MVDIYTQTQSNMVMDIIASYRSQSELTKMDISSRFEINGSLHTSKNFGGLVNLTSN